ncbi:MAG: hypothetical protein B6D64_09990 [Bacteroidetes bacterium 4484_276]|nr:MAG: hypothetical protein B6D64_09990 [Bacteroidetes bacterium 4484_276]
MLAIHGIYDGKNIKITDKITEKKNYKVIITFIEEINQNDEDLRTFSSQTRGLEFWNDTKEDVYHDYLK